MVRQNRFFMNIDMFVTNRLEIPSSYQQLCSQHHSQGRILKPVCSNVCSALDILWQCSTPKWVLASWACLSTLLNLLSIVFPWIRMSCFWSCIYHFYICPSLELISCFPQYSFKRIALSHDLLRLSEFFNGLDCCFFVTSWLFLLILWLPYLVSCDWNIDGIQTWECRKKV